jgi:hypothetical protein
MRHRRWKLTCAVLILFLSLFLSAVSSPKRAMISMMELTFADVFFPLSSSQMDTAVVSGLKRYAHAQSLHRTSSTSIFLVHIPTLEMTQKYCASCPIQYCFLSLR